MPSDKCKNPRSDNPKDHLDARRVLTERLVIKWRVYWMCYACDHHWEELTDKKPK